MKVCEHERRLKEKGSDFNQKKKKKNQEDSLRGGAKGRGFHSCEVGMLWVFQ